MKTLAVYNLKGGVGKTSTAVSLAWSLADAGQRVLLWDLDPQAAATWLLGHEPGIEGKVRDVWAGRRPLADEILGSAHPLLRVLPADPALRHSDLRLDEAGSKALRRLLKPLREDFDLVILDCPPSLSRLAEQVFVASDAVLMPLIPTHLSLLSFRQVRAFFAQRGFDPERLWPLFSLVDRRRGLHREWLYQPPQELAGRMKTFIPYSTRVEQMGEHRAPVEVFAPADPIARAYRQLAGEVLGRLPAAPG